MIAGLAGEIADALAGYQGVGITHLIVHVWPRTPETCTNSPPA